MKTRDAQIEFMRMNGVRVAACAWNGFQEKGRGAVCVLSELENEVQRTVPFDFMPQEDAPKLLKPWVGSREWKMVQSYDAEVEIVVFFLWKGEADKTMIDSYKIRTSPAPPAAAEKE